MDNISHFIITYDTSYKNIKAIIWRICSAPNFAIYCYHVVMHHTTTPQPQFLTIPRSPIDPVQCWRGFVEQQGKMFSRNFVDRKQNIGLILDCQRNHSTTRNRSSGLNFFNKIEQCSAKAARDCFLYEIAVIELIYGPLNAASVVIYADCMQQI